MWRGSGDHHLIKTVIFITYSNADVRDIPFSGEHLTINDTCTLSTNSKPLQHTMIYYYDHSTEHVNHKSKKHKISTHGIQWRS